MKRLAVLVAASALAIPLVAACDSDKDSVAAVCVDGSGERVDDSYCDHSNGYPGFLWFYYPYYLGVPGIHQQVVHNTTYITNNPYQSTAPPSTKTLKRPPATSAPKAVNPAPKVNSPQDRPNPNIKPAAPANPAPKPVKKP